MLHRPLLGDVVLVAAGTCVVGTLVVLAGQLGWWTLLAGPTYLAAAALAVMVARGRVQALLAVALASGSIGLLAGLVKLTGLI
jgi:hypothetical protein